MTSAEVTNLKLHDAVWIIYRSAVHAGTVTGVTHALSGGGVTHTIDVAIANVDFYVMSNATAAVYCTKKEALKVLKADLEEDRNKILMERLNPLIERINKLTKEIKACDT